MTGLDAALVVSGAAPVASNNWWDAGFFSWPGWAFIQALGAVGTIVALVILILQFGLSRAQLRTEALERRSDYERARTPDLSIEVTGVNARLDVPTVFCRINADGAGVAYNVILNVYRIGVGPPPVGEAKLVRRYLRAPGSAEHPLEWPHGWGNEVGVQVEIPYRSTFGRQFQIVHTGFIGGPEGLRITNEPIVQRQLRNGKWISAAAPLKPLKRRLKGHPPAATDSATEQAGLLE